MPSRLSPHCATYSIRALARLAALSATAKNEPENDPYRLCATLSHHSLTRTASCSASASLAGRPLFLPCTRGSSMVRLKSRLGSLTSATQTAPHFRRSVDPLLVMLTFCIPSSTDSDVGKTDDSPLCCRSERQIIRCRRTSSRFTTSISSAFESTWRASSPRTGTFGEMPGLCHSPRLRSRHACHTDFIVLPRIG